MSEPRDLPPQDEAPRPEADPVELETPEQNSSTPDEGGAEAAEDPETQLEAQNSELKERVLRVTAEMDNLRKRSARDVMQARQRGIAELATSLLDVIDNLERALEAAPADDGLAQGVGMVHQQLLERLASLGVDRIRPEGQLFDPHFHEALMQEARTDVAPGTVLDELMPGYRMGDTLLRAAKVRVAKAEEAAGDGEKGQGAAAESPN